MYIILALLGLSFLIFIHELGHYIMARRVGMRVEVFAIGFGKPIYSWERDGVKWQIGWLPFGGYVKIAGTETEEGQDPYEIADGFFGKGPWARIKVAFMGPFVNLVFAFIIFGLMWTIGGREKSFGEYTSKIGWVDTKSMLYAHGVRPGDEITAYGDYSFQGAKDHLYAPMTNDTVDIKGIRIDYANGQKTPFEYTLNTYAHPSSLDGGLKTVGVLQSANYIFYKHLLDGSENPLPEGSPLEGSGIEYGDRILWVDGEVIFSLKQLNDILNDGRALLTIERGNEKFLRRVPRVRIEELHPDAEFKEELIDWQYEAGITGGKIDQLFAVPYNLTYNCIIESQLKFIDGEVQDEVFQEHPFSALEAPLMPGDRIIAIDGTPVKFSYQMFFQLQENRVNIVVQRNEALMQRVSWQKADAAFDQQMNWDDIQKIAKTIGTGVPVKQAGDLVLLSPVIPKKRTDLLLSPEKQEWYATSMRERKKLVEGIEDSEQRAQALSMLEDQENELLLGLPGIQDRRVNYNPRPAEMFVNVFQEIWRTLTALVSGALNPKWIHGPIGIVHLMQSNWMTSIKEALFWIGAISLNLGILNLLPIPILDGGTIVFSFFELITRRRIKPKTLEKIIVPFAILLVTFFVYLTYNDLSRIFGGFFH